MATTDTSSTWDEERCKAALAELERLQTQLDDLRLAIPRVVQPFNSHQTRGPVIFKQFSSAVVNSQNDVRAFRARWESEQIQSIYKHAGESLARDADLSASVRVSKYGWVEREAEEKAKAGRREIGAQRKEEAVDGLDKEEVRRVLAEFRKEYPRIAVAMKEDNQDMLISFVAGDLKLKFRVLVEQEDNGRRKLHAECLGSMNPFPSINRCIASRPRPNDFKYLLDMIAAYKTVKASKCAKCDKLLDSSAMVPTARRSRVLSGNEEPTTAWEAFHESCLE